MSTRTKRETMIADMKADRFASNYEIQFLCDSEEFSAIFRNHKRATQRAINKSLGAYVKERGDISLEERHADYEEIKKERGYQ